MLFIGNTLYRHNRMIDVDMYVKSVIVNKADEFITMDVLWFHRKYEYFIGHLDRVIVRKEEFNNWMKVD